MLNLKKTLKKLTLLAFAFALLPISSVSAANEGGIVVSPPYQMLVLSPGETVRNTITITNPNSSKNDITYALSIASFGVTDDTDYTVDYRTITERNDIMNWITFGWEEGTLAPNETVQVPFIIKVPKDAPSGGQYASINVTKTNKGSASGEGVAIMEDIEISSLIYATITGETKETGEILENKIPAFFFSGPLKTSTLIKNTGNVHQTVTYTLQVFPLFSDEEVFTNEEKPSTATILPDQTYQFSPTWAGLPLIGIFKVVQTVEFAGQTSSVNRFVIVCPLWLLFIIVVAVFLIVFWLFSKQKARQKA